MLLVGQSFQTAHGSTDRLRRWGFRCHFAGSMRTACKLLSSVRVDMVLSGTRLSDGTGFGLLGALAGLPVTAFLCLSVEKWLLLAARHRWRKLTRKAIRRASDKIPAPPGVGGSHTKSDALSENVRH